MLDRLVASSFQRGHVRDVADDDRAGPVVCSQPSLGVVGGVRIDLDADRGPAIVGQPLQDGPPESLAAAGDDDAPRAAGHGAPPALGPAGAASDVRPGGSSTSRIVTSSGARQTTTRMPPPSGSVWGTIGERGG